MTDREADLASTTGAADAYQPSDRSPSRALHQPPLQRRRPGARPSRCHLAPTLRWTMGRDDACVRVVDSRGAPLLKVHGDHIRFRVATTTPVPMFGREASRNQASRYIAVDSRATSDHDLKRLLAAAERHDPPARGADVGSRTRRRTPLQVCAACGLELPLSGRCDCTD